MSTHATAGKYLTFFLGAEEYGMAILAVHEIIGVLPITRVPRTPPFVRGVINLRGRVISIIDLRLKFDLPALDPGPTSCNVARGESGVHASSSSRRTPGTSDCSWIACPKLPTSRPATSSRRRR